jgi:hypothetical protein
VGAPPALRWTSAWATLSTLVTSTRAFPPCLACSFRTLIASQTRAGARSGSADAARLKTRRAAFVYVTYITVSPASRARLIIATAAVVFPVPGPADTRHQGSRVCCPSSPRAMTARCSAV